MVGSLVRFRPFRDAHSTFSPILVDSLLHSRAFRDASFLLYSYHGGRVLCILAFPRAGSPFLRPWWTVIERFSHLTDTLSTFYVPGGGLPAILAFRCCNFKASPTMVDSYCLSCYVKRLPLYHALIPLKPV